MKKIFLLSLSLLLIIALAGCAKSKIRGDGDTATDDQPPKKEKVVKEKKVKEKGNQTDVADIKIYRTKPPTRPYEEIGTVSAQRYSAFSVLPVAASNEKMDKELKKKAAKMGGDAVIITNTDFVSVNGVVIVFTDKAKPAETQTGTLVKPAAE